MSTAEAALNSDADQSFGTTKKVEGRCEVLPL
jgi:hypothetical protein